MNNALKILVGLIFLALFFYSFLNIMDFEGVATSRQESFMRVFAALAQPNFQDGETTRQVAEGMWETVQMAFLATVMSAWLATPFTFASARPSSIWGRGVNFVLQPFLSAVRAVHPLIFTVPVIIFVGIGPTAGVLALTFFSTAVLSGIFSEYAQQHPSLSWSILFKVHFPGLALKHLPVNLVIASVLGFMGGGGIGFFIQQYISLLNYGNVSVALLACILVIGGMDLCGRMVWRKVRAVE